jgi:engulfment and cell motility protein 1
VDSAVKFPVRNGLEDLPERIEIAQISEIATGNCAPPPNVLRDQNDLPTSQLEPSSLSFSLLSAHEGSLADQIAPDQSRWADWTDGLNMLRRDGGHVASQETAGFVLALTEIGLKIKLLGELNDSTCHRHEILTCVPQICRGKRWRFQAACQLDPHPPIPISSFQI